MRQLASVDLAFLSVRLPALWLKPGDIISPTFCCTPPPRSLLFLVLRRMTGELWPSAFVAALFAIHPLRVESVAWVAERKDVLSGLFFMLTLGGLRGLCPPPVFAGALSGW